MQFIKKKYGVLQILKTAIEKKLTGVLQISILELTFLRDAHIILAIWFGNKDLFYFIPVLFIIQLCLKLLTETSYSYLIELSQLNIVLRFPTPNNNLLFMFSMCVFPNLPLADLFALISSSIGTYFLFQEMLLAFCNNYN